MSPLLPNSIQRVYSYQKSDIENPQQHRNWSISHVHIHIIFIHMYRNWKMLYLFIWLSALCSPFRVITIFKKFLSATKTFSFNVAAPALLLQLHNCIHNVLYFIIYFIRICVLSFNNTRVRKRDIVLIHLLYISLRVAAAAIDTHNKSVWNTMENTYNIGAQL